MEDNRFDIGAMADGYDKLCDSIQQSFSRYAEVSMTHRLFRTDAFGLYDLFLSKLPAEKQQEHNCHTCRQFMNKYGGLVSIDREGRIVPAAWCFDDIPETYRPAVVAIKKRLENAKVTGAFIPRGYRIETPSQTGVFQHMAVLVFGYAFVNMGGNTKYPGRAENTAKENYKTLCHALSEYRLEHVQTAFNILNSNSVRYVPQARHHAEWFLSVVQDIRTVRGSRRNNLIWRYAVSSPSGYCHVCTSVLGTLLDDIKAGKALSTAAKRFDDKASPTKYQRPQTGPSDGNIDTAEKIIKELGLETALLRRFARFDEVKTFWTPVVEPKAIEGVFGYLRQKAPTYEPETVMSWEKFQRTILPGAITIDYDANASRMGNYAALITAVDSDAPPIIKWDNLEHRNPVNWFTFTGGSDTAAWFDRPGGWRPVLGIAHQPNMWAPGNESAGDGVIFIVSGCKPQSYGRAGVALFPEHLIPQLHEVRSTIWAYSKTQTLFGIDDASACGILLQEGTGSTNKPRFRVKTNAGTMIYTIDRWD